MKKRCLVYTFLLALLGLQLSGSMAQAHSAVCSQTNYSVRIRNGVSARVSLFETLVPEGAVIMILGPKRSYVDSKKFINTFCNHGLSVVAFDLLENSKGRPTRRGAKPSIHDSDYLYASQLITQRLRAVRKHLPLMAYGYGKGAIIAAQLVKSGGFHRLILENPSMNTHFALTLSRLPKGTTKVFACREDLSAHARDFRYLHGATVLVPAHSAECSHHQLSSMAEAQDSMGDFIESDFAGVRANNWYFKRL